MRSTIRFLFALAVLLLSNSWVAGQPPPYFSQSLVSPNPAELNEFGRSVAIHGNRAIVGELLDDHSFRKSVGAAHIYDLVGDAWTHYATLIGAGYTLRDDDYFGASVALADDVAVVGAPAFFHPGHAVVFERQGSVWTPVATFEATGAAVPVSRPESRTGW